MAITMVSRLRIWVVCKREVADSVEVKIMPVIPQVALIKVVSKI